MVNRIIQGDVIDVLGTLANNSIHCVVTSPPYFNKRHYLPNGHPNKHLEVGLETTPAVHIAKMVQVFREIRRVLRPDGTCWLNLGDGYANDSKWGGERKYEGFKNKDLLLMPARIAIALQEDGWWIRSNIIWYKTNCMPDPTKDRLVCAHEHIFLLTKSEHYYFDAEAICEPLRPKTLTTFGSKHHSQGNNEQRQVKSDNWGSSMKERGPRLTPDGKIAGAHKRDVWSVASSDSPGTHYASYPQKLVEPCILAGTSPQCCEYCGAPWQRVTEHTAMVTRKGPRSGEYGSRTTDGLSGTMLAPPMVETIGWEPSCLCDNIGSGKCIVLDPFAGSGTTLLTSAQWQRDWLGIELFEEYITLANDRLAIIQPRLWTDGALGISGVRVETNQGENESEEDSQVAFVQSSLWEDIA